MKKLKIVTICLVLGIIVLQNIAKASYYKQLLGFNLNENIGMIFSVIQTGLTMIFDVVIMVLGIMALANGDAVIRNRTYTILRFMFVMMVLLTLPGVIFSITATSKYFTTASSLLSYILPYAINMVLVVLLLICNPETQILKVNLQEYDVVALTSTGHRFVHYLIDTFFMFPIWLSSMGGFMFASLSRHSSSSPIIILQLILILSFLVYYFLSEAVFRQTLGKMVTHSCVVSDGTDLSTGRIFLRTLCRLIPFDNFSFLFGAKWHDQLSATAVVYVDSWEKAFDEKQQAVEA